MSLLTRRLFIRRSGAVTLGSALGLGLLPSVTRRLHATDTSTQLYAGIKFDWTDVGAPPAQPALNYPPGAAVGRMEVTVSISSTIGKNNCASAGIISVNRVAVYTEVRKGATYTGTTTIPSWYAWACVNGVSSITSSGTDTSQKDAAISNGGSSIGTLRSEDSSEGGYKARVYADGTYGPWVTVDAGFTATCCPL